MWQEVEKPEYVSHICIMAKANSCVLCITKFKLIESRSIWEYLTPKKKYSLTLCDDATII